MCRWLAYTRSPVLLTRVLYTPVHPRSPSVDAFRPTTAWWHARVFRAEGSVLDERYAPVENARRHLMLAG